MRRTGFLGVEQVPVGSEGDEAGAGTSIEIQEGTEVTVTHGFCLGAEGIFKDVFAAGLTYECALS